MRRVLLDTGPFVALLSARDRSHAAVVAAFRMYCAGGRRAFDVIP